MKRIRKLICRIFGHNVIHAPRSRPFSTRMGVCDRCHIATRTEGEE